MPKLKLNVCSSRGQSALRANNYKELHGAIVAGDGDLRNAGQKVVLPATFTGDP